MRCSRSDMVTAHLVQKPMLVLLAMKYFTYIAQVVLAYLGGSDIALLSCRLSNPTD